MRIWEKEGESMRSEVSSRSRRRGGEVVVRGGEGEECGEGMSDGFAAMGMPDSRRTKSSWSGVGSR